MAKAKEAPTPVAAPPKTTMYFIGLDVHTYDDKTPLRMQTSVRCGSVEEAIPIAAAQIVQRIKDGDTFSL